MIRFVILILATTFFQSSPVAKYSKQYNAEKSAVVKVVHELNALQPMVEKGKFNTQKLRSLMDNPCDFIIGANYNSIKDWQATLGKDYLNVTLGNNPQLLTQKKIPFMFSYELVLTKSPKDVRIDDAFLKHFFTKIYYIGDEPPTLTENGSWEVDTKAASNEYVAIFFTVKGGVAVICKILDSTGPPPSLFFGKRDWSPWGSGHVRQRLPGG